MKASWLISLAVGVAVAFSSRTAEWTFGHLAPRADRFSDYVGMTIAGLTAMLLCHLWQKQSRERSRLARERERIMRHLHHHIRNSLQIIAYRSEDSIVRENVDRIVRELNYALPGNGRSMPHDKERELKAKFENRHP